MSMEVASPSGGERRRWAALLGVCAVVAAVAWMQLARAPRGASDPPEQAVVTFERHGLRYEFHVLTGREGLYDAKADPHGLVNLLQGREVEAASLRRDLEAQLDVPDLESLRVRMQDKIRRLHALGYL